MSESICPTCHRKDAMYNGWPNYETWAVALWIYNEEPSSQHAKALADSAKDEAKEERNAHATCERCTPNYCPMHRVAIREARYILADNLKDWIEKDAPDLGPTLWADLLSTSLSEVNWVSIADNYLYEEGEA